MQGVYRLILKSAPEILGRKVTVVVDPDLVHEGLAALSHNSFRFTCFRLFRFRRLLFLQNRERKRLWFYGYSLQRLLAHGEDLLLPLLILSQFSVDALPAAGPESCTLELDLEPLLLTIDEINRWLHGTFHGLLEFGT